MDETFIRVHNINSDTCNQVNTYMEFSMFGLAYFASEIAYNQNSIERTP